MGGHPLFARLRTTIRRCFRRPRGTAAHFRHVIGLAAASAGRDKPALRSPKNRPLISFVVPVFNTKPQYLNELIASFKVQPRDLCEFILSDDGSTSPQTQRWLDGHADIAGITILRADKNLGIAAATNRGIAHAAGQWIGL